MIYISLVAIIFFIDCVEWYFLPKTEIKVFLKKMDIRGFGWRPSILLLRHVRGLLAEIRDLLIANQGMRI